MNFIKSFLLIAAIGGFNICSAQVLASGEKQEILQRIKVPNTNYNMVLGITDIPANESKPYHTHKFPEVVYILEGDISVSIKNKKPFVVKKGESFQMPPNTLHETKAGKKGAKIIFTIIADKK